MNISKMQNNIPSFFSVIFEIRHFAYANFNKVRREREREGNHAESLNDI